MPRKSKLKLPPLNLGDETLGERIARLRKQRGCSQAELAEEIGIIQRLISDYERDRLRPHPEMIIRFARALEVTSDELLGISVSGKNFSEKKTDRNKLSRKFFNRLKKIESLPLSYQNVLLKVIDTFVKGAEEIRK